MSSADVGTSARSFQCARRYQGYRLTNDRQFPRSENVWFRLAVTNAVERLVDIAGAPGIRLRVTEAGQRGAQVVVLVHGFPELAYSWRHQIGALAAAGYHVLAPDQRGYGGSSCPAAVSDYDIVALTGDIVALIDDAGADRAVVIGHDWGATVAWNTALLHPDRVCAVAGLSVPPVPRSRVRPTEAFAKFGEDFYMLRFQRPGLADAELGADPAATMRSLFAEGRPDLPDWIRPEEVAHYVTEFTRTGFTGGLNWYRNLDRNWELTARLAGRRITVPALFVAGAADPVLTFTRTDRAAEVVSGPYREVLIAGAGHWVQQDSAAEINRILLEFLAFASG
jgi:pimeloyl-ACP methyl ester carboxylesterase